MTDDLQNNKRYLETMTPATGRMIKDDFTIANIADCFDLDDEGNLSLRISGGGGGGDGLWEIVGTYIKPLLNRKAVMTGNAEIPKSGTATAEIPQYPSKEFFFTTSYWNGASEEERKIRLKMYEDSGVEWLSFIDQAGNEFLLLRNLGSKSFDLISRQGTGEKEIQIGTTGNLGASDYIAQFRNNMAVENGTNCGGFFGNGDIGIVNNVRSVKRLSDVEVLSANLLENSDMTDWGEQAEDWEFDDLMQGTFPTRTDDASVGDYAVLLNGNEEEDSVLEQEQITVTPEEEYDPSLDVKDGTAYYSISYESGVDLYSFRWTGINAGTWQLGFDDDSNFECVGGVGSYSTITPTAVTIPAGITEVSVEVFSDETVKVDNVKLVDENEVNVMTNGSFETWNYVYPSDYFFGSLTETSNAYLEREEIEFYSTPYSVKMIAGSTPEDYSFFAQGSETQYKNKFSFYLKQGTATTARLVLFSLGDDDNNYKIFHFTGTYAQTWQPFVSIGAENIYTFNLTANWEQYTYDNIPYNENETVTAGLLSPEVEGQYYYIDDFEMKEYARPNVDFHTLSIWENNADLFANDVVFQVKTLDDVIPFQIKKGCVFDTDDNQFDLEQADVPTLVKHSYDELKGAVNKFSSKSLLGLVSGVDLKDDTTVYEFNFELPEGSYIVNPEVVVLISSADSLNGNAQFEIKNTGSSLIGGESIGITAQLKQKVFNGNNINGNGIGTLLNAGNDETITLQITTADTGTSGTAIFYLFGTIYDETYNGNVAKHYN